MAVGGISAVAILAMPLKAGAHSFYVSCGRHVIAERLGDS